MCRMASRYRGVRHGCPRFLRSYSVNLITYNRSALLLIQREQCSIQATTDEGDEATQRAGGPRGEGLRALGPALLSRFGKKPNLHFHGGRGRTNKQEPRRPSMLRSSAGAALADPRFFERTVPLPSRVVNTTAAEVCSPAAAMSAAQRGAWSRVFAALRSGGTVSATALGSSYAIPRRALLVTPAIVLLTWRPAARAQRGEARRGRARARRAGAVTRPRGKRAGWAATHGRGPTARRGAARRWRRGHIEARRQATHGHRLATIWRASSMCCGRVWSRRGVFVGPVRCRHDAERRLRQLIPVGGPTDRIGADSWSSVDELGLGEGLECGDFDVRLLVEHEKPLARDRMRPQAHHPLAACAQAVKEEQEE